MKEYDYRFVTLYWRTPSYNINSGCSWVVFQSRVMPTLRLRGQAELLKLERAIHACLAAGTRAVEQQLSPAFRLVSTVDGICLRYAGLSQKLESSHLEELRVWLLTASGSALDDIMPRPLAVNECEVTHGTLFLTLAKPGGEELPLESDDPKAVRNACLAIAAGQRGSFVTPECAITTHSGRSSFAIRNDRSGKLTGLTVVDLAAIGRAIGAACAAGS